MKILLPSFNKNFSENRVIYREALRDDFSDDSLDDTDKPHPRSCFGQLFEEYVDNMLVTTFVLDGNDWLLYNHQDMEYGSSLENDLGQKDICTSVGSAGFISSMEPNSDDSSGAGTAFEVATPDDIAELQR